MHNILESAFAGMILARYWALGALALFGKLWEGVQVLFIDTVQLQCFPLSIRIICMRVLVLFPRI